MELTKEQRLVAALRQGFGLARIDRNNAWARIEELDAQITRQHDLLERVQNDEQNVTRMLEARVVECEELQKEVNRLKKRSEAGYADITPLCSPHADMWYCSRNHIQTKSGCVFCDHETEAHDFENFHSNLCKRFRYHHDPVDWRRDLASLEEHIAGLIPEKTSEDLATGFIKAIRGIDLFNNEYREAAIEDLTTLIEKVKEQSR